MKNIWIGCLIGGLALCSSAWAQTSQPGGNIEKAIAALENQWLQSQKTNNPDLVAPLLAEKFVNTAADGKVTDRSQTLTNAKARRYASAEYENIRVTVFGDTAIATGGYKGQGTDNGKPFEEHERWTDTWVKMPDGKWQCVATQASSVRL